MLTLISHKGEKRVCEHKSIGAPLAPAYTIAGQHATTPAIDEIETMLPWPDAFKSGWASCHEWNMESRLVDIIEE